MRSKQPRRDRGSVAARVRVSRRLIIGGHGRPMGCRVPAAAHRAGVLVPGQVAWLTRTRRPARRAARTARPAHRTMAATRLGSEADPVPDASMEGDFQRLWWAARRVRDRGDQLVAADAEVSRRHDPALLKGGAGDGHGGGLADPPLGPGRGHGGDAAAHCRRRGRRGVVFGVFHGAEALLRELGVPPGRRLVGAVAIGRRAAGDAPTGSARTRRRSPSTRPSTGAAGDWAGRPMATAAVSPMWPSPRWRAPPVDPPENHRQGARPH